MPVGQLWGTLFFLFMSFAALSTVVAVFENIMSFSMDEWGWSRNRACLVNGIALALLSLPCVLGFNVWAGVEVPGIGNIQAIEDFLMSNNVLPLGALVFLLFCTSKRGWVGMRFCARPTRARHAPFLAGLAATCASRCPCSSWRCSWPATYPSCKPWLGLG